VQSAPLAGGSGTVCYRAGGSRVRARWSGSTGADRTRTAHHVGSRTWRNGPAPPPTAPP